jgi:hypothetical protein
VGGHRAAVIAVAASSKEQDNQQTEKRLCHLQQKLLHIRPWRDNVHGFDLPGFRAGQSFVDFIFWDLSCQ